MKVRSLCTAILLCFIASRLLVAAANYPGAGKPWV